MKNPTIDGKTCQSIVSNVNKLVKQQNEGRLFAIVHLCGKQYKITTGDIVVIEGYWAPTVGDQIRLEKVSYHLNNYQTRIAYSYILFRFYLQVVKTLH